MGQGNESKSHNEGDTAKPLSVADFERIAKQKLRKQVWEYYVLGAEEQKSVARNREAYSRLLLRPRVFRDVGDIYK